MPTITNDAEDTVNVNNADNAEDADDADDAKHLFQQLTTYCIFLPFLL
jgi:hypothetical protein